MIIDEIFRKDIEEQMKRRGFTKFHITGIRHGDFKDNANAFIEEAARNMLEVILLPDETNLLDHEAVLCYYGNKKIGSVATYDLEKYHALARKKGTDHMNGHFFFGNTGDHLLDLSVNGTLTLEDIYSYRKEIDNKKDAIYRSWNCGSIERYIIHCRHQNDAKASIIQMKEFTQNLFLSYGSETQKQLKPLLENYKESSQYDISLEGQRDRWDILLHLDYLYDAHHKPYVLLDKEFEEIITDVTSQIGGELVRSVSYTSYVERLKELITVHLPSSDKAQQCLNMLPAEAFEEMRQQVQNYPYYLYNLYKNDLDGFVKNIYYSRIPRKYLDAFLSGIALVEAFDKKRASEGKPSPILPKNSTKNVRLFPHFDLEVPNDFVFETSLEIMTTGKYLDKKTTAAEWKYVCTGEGEEPEGKLNWVGKVNGLAKMAELFNNEKEVKDGHQALAAQIFTVKGKDTDRNKLKSAANAGIWEEDEKKLKKALVGLISTQD